VASVLEAIPAAMKCALEPNSFWNAGSNPDTAVEYAQSSQFVRSSISLSANFQPR
jgi:hypothetical protein